MDDTTDQPTDAQYIADNGDSGNPYVANMTPVDSAADGSVTVSPSATPSTAGAGATVTTSAPSWLTGFQSILQTGSGAVTTLAPIVNGKPAAPTSVPTSTNGGSAVATPTRPAVGGSSTMLMLAGAAILAFLFFGKKR